MSDLPIDEARVRALLTRWYGDARPMLETSSTGSIHGVVVSAGFAGKSDRERQAELWGHLRSDLEPAQLALISYILASTPEEARVLEDAPPDAD